MGASGPSFLVEGKPDIADIRANAVSADTPAVEIAIRRYVFS